MEGPRRLEIQGADWLPNWNDSEYKRDTKYV